MPHGATLIPCDRCKKKSPGGLSLPTGALVCGVFSFGLRPGPGAKTGCTVCASRAEDASWCPDSNNMQIFDEPIQVSTRIKHHQLRRAFSLGACALAASTAATAPREEPQSPATRRHGAVVRRREAQRTRAGAKRSGAPPRRLHSGIRTRTRRATPRCRRPALVCSGRHWPAKAGRRR